MGSCMPECNSFLGFAIILPALIANPTESLNTTFMCLKPISLTDMAETMIANMIIVFVLCILFFICFSLFCFKSFDFVYRIDFFQFEVV